MPIKYPRIVVLEAIHADHHKAINTAAFKPIWELFDLWSGVQQSFTFGELQCPHCKVGIVAWTRHTNGQVVAQCSRAGCLILISLSLDERHLREMRKEALPFQKHYEKTLV